MFTNEFADWLAENEPQTLEEAAELERVVGGGAPGDSYRAENKDNGRLIHGPRGILNLASEKAGDAFVKFLKKNCFVHPDGLSFDEQLAWRATQRQLKKRD